MTNPKHENITSESRGKQSAKSGGSLKNELMMKRYEDKYHKIEDDLWWFVARRDMILRIVSGLGLERGAAILDVGCSGGALISGLRREGYNNVSGIDLSGEAVKICKSNGLSKVKVADACATGYSSSAFDLVIASDILEHIQDESKALFEWKRILKRGGRLVVFVPAFSLLWGSHDRANRHFRRYSWRMLKAALKKGGYAIERHSYWNGLLFAPTLAVRIAKRAIGDKGSQDEFIRMHKIPNRILTQMLTAENIIIGKIPLPLGVSLFAVARKP